MSRHAAECHCILSRMRGARYMQRVVGTKEHSSPGGCVPALELSREEKGSQSLKTYVIDPGSFGFLRLTARLVLFLTRGRCNRTLRHFCQNCIVHSVCNLRSSPSRHRALHIVSHRQFRSCEFYGSSRPSKNICLRNNEIITFALRLHVRIYGIYTMS